MATNCRIAVLLTCHNRRDTTLAALQRLFAQESPIGTRIFAFLVDDGSTDGTSAAVIRDFPEVRVLRGDGSLYWGGGMRLAFAEAAKQDFDYFLWLNDDSFLEQNAIARLLQTHTQLQTTGHAKSMVIGSLCDPDSGQLTYGGLVRSSRFHPFKFRLLHPCDKPQMCDTANGNVVLIPRKVATMVTNISSAYKHGIGDFDYVLRARRLGCSAWIAPGFVGACRRNSCANTWRDTNLPLKQRIQIIASTKGLPSGEYRAFVKYHGGLLWPLFWLLPYIRVFSLTFASAVWMKLRRNAPIDESPTTF